MPGDGRQRFCGECGRFVHNVEALHSSELRELLQGEGHPPCLRLRTEEGGAPVTADSLIPRKLLSRVRRVLATAAALVLAQPLPGCQMGAIAQTGVPRRDERCEPLMGSVVRVAQDELVKPETSTSIPDLPE